MRRQALALLTLVILPSLRAQQSFDPVSRSAGGIWLRNGADPWCAITAPPLLASVRGVNGGAAYFPSAWGLGPLTASSAVVAVPAGVGAVGFALTRYGTGAYRETGLGIAWGSAKGALLFGATVRLRHLAIDRYGSAWTPGLDFAAVVTTGDWFRCGIRVTDLNRGALGRSGERLRQGLSLAASAVAPGFPGLLLQAGNDDGGAFSVRAAITLEAEPVVLRAGASGSFSRIHAGIEYPAGRFVAGYGVVVHPVLGWSHAFWISAGAER